MKRVRGSRAIALVIAAVLALFGTVAVAAPASATAGLIDGYVYELDGTTPIVGTTVLWDDGSTPAAYVTTTTDNNGYYFFTPAPGYDDEAFEIVAYGGSTHIDGDDTGFYDTADATSGEMPDFLLAPGRRITGVVTDAGTGLPLEDVLVVATGETSGQSFASLPPTGATGVFDVGVLPDDDYALIAFDGSGDYDPQAYDHLNFSVLMGCGCTDPDVVTVPAATGPAITGIDFDLLAYDEWIWFSVYAAKKVLTTEYPGVRVYLDKWDSGTNSWDPVSSARTDSDGFVNLFGYQDGDYRLRYKIGSSFVKVLSYDDYIGPPFPVWEGGKSVHLPGMTTGGCGCGFTEQDVDLIFAASSGGGGGTGGTPPAGPRPNGGTNATTSEVPTPTATPTPTPTPTPSSTPTSEPTTEPSPSPTPTTEPHDGTPVDFSWAWWLLLVLLIGIVILIIALLRRRR